MAVEAALSGVVGPFDISPQIYPLGPSDNPSSDTDITALNFPPSDVRAATIRYTVHRTTDTPNEVDEAGLIMIVYNDLTGTFDQSQVKTSDASITFSVSNTGQVSFSTTNISGSNHSGFITFAAQSLLND